MNKKVLATILGGMLIASASGNVLAQCKVNVLKGFWSVQINVPTELDLTVFPWTVQSPGTTLTCRFNMLKDGTSQPSTSACVQAPGSIYASGYGWGNLRSVVATPSSAGQCRFDLALTFEDGKGGGRQTDLTGRMTTDKKGMMGEVAQGDSLIGAFTGFKTIE
jgi:hypothetical protein